MRPGCRAYEMVSPPEKHGGSIAPLLGFHVAPDGNAARFASSASFAESPASPLGNAYITFRGSSWATESVDGLQQNPGSVLVHTSPYGSLDASRTLQVSAADREPARPARPGEPVSRLGRPAVLRFPRPGTHPHRLHARPARGRPMPGGVDLRSRRSEDAVARRTAAWTGLPRSSSHELPDLVVALRGQIEIDLDGRIDSHHRGIRTTFESIPDAPISFFVLRLKGGKKSLLVNSTSLCAKQAAKAQVAMLGQNGDRHAAGVPLGARCGR